AESAIAKRLPQETFRGNIVLSQRPGHVEGFASHRHPKRLPSPPYSGGEGRRVRPGGGAIPDSPRWVSTQGETRRHRRLRRAVPRARSPGPLARFAEFPLISHNWRLHLFPTSYLRS